MEMSMRPVAGLTPYAANSRTHSDEQIKQICQSIKEFGFTNPVLVDEEGGIIAGHGRVMAAKKLGMEDVPCVTMAGLSESQKRAYVIADNQLALNAGWDFETLKLEIEELRSVDFNIELLGFDEGFLSGMFDDEIQEAKEFDGDLSDKWQLLIEYENENELAAAYDECKERGMVCKIIQ